MKDRSESNDDSVCGNIEDEESESQWPCVCEDRERPNDNIEDIIIIVWMNQYVKILLISNDNYYYY